MKKFNIILTLLVFLITVSISWIFLPLNKVNLTDHEPHKTSLFIQQMYLIKLRLHFTIEDFSTIYYIGYKNDNGQTIDEAITIAQKYYKPIQLVRYALFYPSFVTEDLIDKIDFSSKNNQTIILNNWCELRKSDQFLPLFEQKFGYEPSCLHDYPVMSQPYLINEQGHMIEN